MFRTSDRSRAPRTLTAALDEFRGASDSWFDGTVQSVDRRLNRCSKLMHSATSAAAGDPTPYLAVLAELSADRRALADLRSDLLSGASGREAGYTPPAQRTASSDYDETAWHNAAWGDDEDDDEDGDDWPKGTTPKKKKHAGRHDVDPHESWRNTIADDPYFDMLPPVKFEDIPLDGEEYQGKHRAEAALSPEQRRWVVLEAASFHAAQADARTDVAECAERARRHAALRTANRAVIDAFETQVAGLAHRSPRPRVAAAAPVFIGFDDSQLYF